MKMEKLPAFDPDWAGPGDWARMYRACGLQVVPGHAPGTDANWKRPKLSNWKSLQETLVPDATFDRWYGPSGEYAKHYNMGLITGSCSDNIWVLDIDAYKPGALEWWLRLLELHNNGLEVETWRQRTGGGGLQLLFRAPYDFIVPTNKTAIGIDFRGQAGFAVLPPSLHSSGKNYVWEAGCGPWEIEIADAPDWFIEAIVELDKRHSGQPTAGGISTPSGGSNLPPIKTPSPTSDTDAWGHIVDGRDHYMRDIVFACIVKLYQESPIQPLDSHELMLEAFQTYARGAKSRIIGPGSNEDRLEAEGRGITAFKAKWHYTMQQWGTKIAVAANGSKTEEPPEDDGGPVDVGSLSGQPPDREWLVPDWIPKGVVSSLSGDGGMGKTLIAQQLLYACGLGGKWLGIDVPAVRGLGVFCEDDLDELHRRHIAIKSDLGHPINNPFTDTWIWPRVGFDNLLVSFDREGRPTMSPFFASILKFVLEKKVGFLALDTAADLFGGNEIIRSQVNFFIKATCGAFIKQAKDAGFALSVLLLSHPSQAGRASGTGESGSTAWNNAVRARLYLTRPEDGLPEQRTLTRKKSNYSASGDDVKLELLWKDGVLRPASSENEMAVRSAMQQIKTEVERAWEEGHPYHGNRGPAGRRLDPEMRRIFGTRMPVEVIVSALEKLRNSGEIEVTKTKDQRGYRAK